MMHLMGATTSPRHHINFTVTSSQVHSVKAWFVVISKRKNTTKDEKNIIKKKKKKYSYNKSKIKSDAAGMGQQGSRMRST